MTIVDVEEIPIHAGSIRIFVKNAKENIKEAYLITFNFSLKNNLPERKPERIIEE